MNGSACTIGISNVTDVVSFRDTFHSLCAGNLHKFKAKLAIVNPVESILYLLDLFKQFSDFIRHSLEKVFVFPESSVPQMGTYVTLQFVSQPLVCSC